jgi:hypothetical protein
LSFLGAIVGITGSYDRQKKTAIAISGAERHVTGYEMWDRAKVWAKDHVDAFKPGSRLFIVREAILASNIEYSFDRSTATNLKATITEPVTKALNASGSGSGSGGSATPSGSGVSGGSPGTSSGSGAASGSGGSSASAGPGGSSGTARPGGSGSAGGSSTAGSAGASGSSGSSGPQGGGGATGSGASGGSGAAAPGSATSTVTPPDARNRVTQSFNPKIGVCVLPDEITAAAGLAGTVNFDVVKVTEDLDLRSD